MKHPHYELIMQVANTPIMKHYVFSEAFGEWTEINEPVWCKTDLYKTELVDHPHKELMIKFAEDADITIVKYNGQEWAVDPWPAFLPNEDYNVKVKAIKVGDIVCNNFYFDSNYIEAVVLEINGKTFSGTVINANNSSSVKVGQQIVLNLNGFVKKD